MKAGELDRSESNNYSLTIMVNLIYRRDRFSAGHRLLLAVAIEIRNEQILLNFYLCQAQLTPMLLT